MGCKRKRGAGCRCMQQTGRERKSVAEIERDVIRAGKEEEERERENDVYDGFARIFRAAINSGLL